MRKITTIISVLLALSLGGCATSNLTVSKALSWDGKYYKKGRTKQCGAWVGTVVKDSGGSPPSNPASSRSWVNWGHKVGSLALAQKGDVIVLKNTYKSGVSHVGIYIGDGKMIHRSTQSAPVKIVSITSGFYKNKIYSIRRR